MTPDESLVAAAQQARQHAFAPYSGFAVGAAVRLRDGRIVTGCNIENATYGLTLCAERVAIFSAIAAGARPGDFEAIAVAAEAEAPTPPCGACRQVLWEFCGDVPVLLANLGTVRRSFRMADLLPSPFDARLLGGAKPPPRGV